MLSRIRKRVLDLDIQSAGGTFSKTIELDKNVSRIHGLLLTASRDDQMYYRGTQKVEINRQEIFADNYESKLLMSGIIVAPNDRYFKIVDGGIDPGNFKVTVEYKDNDTTVTQFTPYRISLYLDYEIQELP